MSVIEISFDNSTLGVFDFGFFEPDLLVPVPADHDRLVLLQFHSACKEQCACNHEHSLLCMG